MKVNNNTWIHVKVCIKSQITLGIYFIMNYLILLGSNTKVCIKPHITLGIYFIMNYDLTYPNMN